MAKSVIGAMVGLACIGAAKASEPAEVHEDLVHSDTPLWGMAHDSIWPNHFTDSDGNFGCSSRVAFGDWKIERAGEDASWRRFANYGVFHCAAIATSAENRENLEKSESRYGFFVQIGSVKSANKAFELWVFQEGTVPGSTYTLLQRKPVDGLIERFEILQTKCPEANLRKGPSLDIFGTTYCAINTQDEMLRFARRMATLPTLGTMTRISETPKTAKPEP